ncbi:Gfo/Idh/MocA family oxidoreductase [Oscillatoria sp. FACHB-1407]|uniref:Gfo/Idh/MocA family protein n=1 Tax=Oscillatoria sp. FACHB-1407 TaxID=2692847 RepID=UPI001683C070|nr:Gfo/Idh/MocA family oxidoreductase [Oscillatoria sp. FACHB-1407]MBD2460642.1 Gfo/Idh/MocA family oxidoreductase [Oscillatoria sp. FACHB-1407]
MPNQATAYNVVFPLRVGLVGTGYAAKTRVETLKTDARSHLIAVAGHSRTRAAEFGKTHDIQAFDSWEALVRDSDIDLVFISTINRDHGAIARAALTAKKHVVIEYPLALDLAEAEELLVLANENNCFLHVEHIELLSGIHQAIVDHLLSIGTPFYVRSSNINPQRPAPQKWTYQAELFGFPLVGAVSRIHRLTNLFGQVVTVSCQSRYWKPDEASDAYTSCLCTAQLRFASGLIAEVIYGKGEALWQGDRSLIIQGEKGAILMDGEEGTLILGDETQSLEVGSRRGLFARDTLTVLDHLEKGTPLYVSPSDSLYALRVADAARQSAETGETVKV